MLKNYPCYLYNGISKIPGFIQLNEQNWIFTVAGFEDTNLNIIQSYREIHNIQYYKLYDLEICGIKITDINGNENIIILEQFVELNSMLRKEMKNIQNLH